MNYNSMLIPSSVTNFNRVIALSRCLLENVPVHTFSSPYSVVPIIAQAMGLSTSLMGSGDSPYSLISFIFSMRKKEKIISDLFAFPMQEKRKIIDEIYDMLAPLLLEETESYMELQIDTKLTPLIRDQRDAVQFREIIQKKFEILATLVGQFAFKNADFGHIIHYGYPEDLNREYNFIERMPTMRARKWREGSFPIVNEIILRKIPQCTKSTKSEIRGWGIIITNYTRELIENSKLRKRKIFQAAKLAKKMGAKIIGMGGLVASFAQGGHWLSEQFPGICFTTGHAYTIANIMEIFTLAAAKVQLNIPTITVAIVGAAGSIGSGCAKLISEYNPRKLILIDVNNFNVSARLNDIADEVQRINKRTNIRVSSNIADISEADVIIVATNSTTSIIKNKYLKPGAIIIDDSFPKNVSRETMEKNKDILLLEGGMIRLPLSVEVLAARNMPDLMDAPLTRLISCKETYGCIAESLTLSIYRHRVNYGLGYADPGLAKQILSQAKNVGFSAAPLQCFDESIDELRFQRIARIVKRHS